MNVSNYENYTIFCIHNTVINHITTVQGNELLVANIVSLLNSGKDACIDYLYCLTSEYKFKKYHELDLSDPKDSDFNQKYCN